MLCRLTFPPTPDSRFKSSSELIFISYVSCWLKINIILSDHWAFKSRPLTSGAMCSSGLLTYNPLRIWKFCSVCVSKCVFWIWFDAYLSTVSFVHTWWLQIFSLSQLACHVYCRYPVSAILLVQLCFLPWKILTQEPYYTPLNASCAMMCILLLCKVVVLALLSSSV